MNVYFRFFNAIYLVVKYFIRSFGSFLRISPHKNTKKGCRASLRNSPQWKLKIVQDNNRFTSEYLQNLM